MGSAGYPFEDRSSCTDCGQNRNNTCSSSRTNRPGLNRGASSRACAGLAFNACMASGAWTPRIEIPKLKAADLRYKVKQLTLRRTLQWSLDALFQKLNPILRGWAQFYRYCTGSKDTLNDLDGYVSDRVWRWMRKKYPKASVRWLLGHRRPSSIRPAWRVWQSQGVEQYRLA
jgi:hypothetical protein